ncbi:MAG: altronate dehydratase [Planctomycetota bacterium]|nr:MAG: altronate dehydratase [Planctomycetota bacterium]
MNADSSSLLPLQEWAVQVHPDDNVAVAKRPLPAGLQMKLPSGRALQLNHEVKPGHRFALIALGNGERVRQYGQPIGTSKGMAAGDWVSHGNMSDEIPVVRDLPKDFHRPAPQQLDPDQCPKFTGILRPDGRVGTRNFLLIVPTSMCASHEAVQIATLAEFRLLENGAYEHVDGVVAIPHNKGCGCSNGNNIEVLLRTLANYAAHPNVGGVLFIDLGCEKTNMELLDAYLKKKGGLGWNKPRHWIGIQEVGGTQAAVKAGFEAVEAMLPQVNEANRSLQPASALTLGVKCGGSDGFSGLTANPALGRAADELIRCGGTVLLTEVPEFCGAEHVLAHRAKDAETGQKVYEMVDWYQQHAARVGAQLAMNPSPGNIEGGLLNIAIKSLGAIAKAGNSRVEGVTDYAQPPKTSGLHLMQGPGYDQESTPGLVAAGAQVVVFTTGRGTTIGNAIAPVIKLASNNEVFERMNEDLDLSAGSILDGGESLDDVGQRIFDHVVNVAAGKVMAKAEINRHREFQVWAEASVSL